MCSELLVGWLQVVSVVVCLLRRLGLCGAGFVAWVVVSCGGSVCSTSISSALFSGSQSKIE